MAIAKNQEVKTADPGMIHQCDCGSYVPVPDGETVSCPYCGSAIWG